MQTMAHERKIKDVLAQLKVPFEIIAIDTEEGKNYKHRLWNETTGKYRQIPQLFNRNKLCGVRNIQ